MITILTGSYDRDGKVGQKPTSETQILALFTIYLSGRVGIFLLLQPREVNKVKQFISFFFNYKMDEMVRKLLFPRQVRASKGLIPKFDKQPHY